MFTSNYRYLHTGVPYNTAYGWNMPNVKAQCSPFTYSNTLRPVYDYLLFIVKYFYKVSWVRQFYTHNSLSPKINIGSVEKYFIINHVGFHRRFAVKLIRVKMPLHVYDAITSLLKACMQVVESCICKPF